ncbi:MAG: hypothetical protein FJ253_03270 [Phycisphaerae bacterium]|nr:hypothetical protein [Phycisphaerae bacterium]
MAREGAARGEGPASRLSRIVVATAIAAVPLASCTSSPRLQGPPPVVELRLAEFEAIEGFQEIRSRQGETIWIAPEAAVDLDDFSTAIIRRQGEDDFLLLNVKAGSRIRLDALTLAHLEKPVAFMIDGEAVYVPELKTSISRQVPVRIGARGITLEEAQRILDAVADLRQFGAKRAASAPLTAPGAAPAGSPTPRP